MSNNVIPPTKETPQNLSAEKIKKQWQVTRRWFMFLVTLVAALTITIIVWVFGFATIVDAPASALDVAANLTVVLAPVLAAAAGVERLLETVFNIIEASWKSLVAYLGRGLRWLNTAKAEVEDSRQWLAEVSSRYNEEMRLLIIKPGTSVADLSLEMQAKIKTAKEMLDLAKERLTEAENNLAEVTSSDGYRSAKAAASIVLGLMIGVIAATIGQLQMFAMLGIGGVPARVDVFITGLVIGSGSYPIHSLVGILQQPKDTLAGAKSFLNRTGTSTKVAAETTTVQTSPGRGTTVQQVEEKVSVKPAEVTSGT
jgi:hypothetical protein